MSRTAGMVLLILAGILIQANIAAAQSENDEYNILFIHHSCGSNWLASWDGGLRDALEDPALNDFDFDVHDATYGDTIGDDTDVRHWLPKFETMIDLVLTFDRSTNIYYTDPTEYNHIVMFKSCYPASDLTGDGTPPGDPYSTSKTIWNYKAAYNGCAEIFKNHPHILWVPVTAPPRNKYDNYTKERGLNAWDFNNWLRNEFVEEYREETGLNNIAPFGFFEVLANAETHPRYPGALKDIYASGYDSHPTQAGNQAATAEFIPFINTAVHAWRQIQGSKNWLSIGAADSVAFHLDAEPGFGGRAFVLLGSMSGVFPGMDVNGYTLPINQDNFTVSTYYNANSVVFPGFQSNLNAAGEADAWLDTPGPLASYYLGRTMHFAYVVHPPTEFASCAWPVVFVP